MAEQRAAGKLAKSTGGDRRAKHRVIKKPDVPTLADQGSTRILAQKLADLDDEAFEDRVHDS